MSPAPFRSRPEPPGGYSRLTFRLTGLSPLLQHNGRLADPMNPIAREMKRITGKRNKTEADHEELARLEFIGGLYVDDGPVLPGELVEAGLIEAAKRVRRGPQAKAGLLCEGNFPLLYDGPREPESLWAVPSFRLIVGVRVQRNRIMRCRPIFRDWACDVTVDFLPSLLNGREVAEMMAVLGSTVGLGDWRPRFGRFAVS